MWHRLHLLVRSKCVPWERILSVFDAEGALLDVGCGPGLMAHLLERAGFRGTYLGLDPDERKIARARKWPGETEQRRFQDGALEDLSESGFQQAALVDVLYLMPASERASFVSSVVRRLAPGGVLVAVTSGGGPPWKRKLDRIQEWVSVELVGLTRGSAVAPCDGREVARLLEASGLVEIQIAEIGAGYLHGFERVTGWLPA